MTQVQPIPKTKTPKKRRQAMPQEVVEAVAQQSHGLCEARLPGCTEHAESLHHRLRAGRINVVENLLAVCRSCHTDSPAAIHRNPAASFEAGFLVHNHSEEARRLREEAA